MGDHKLNLAKLPSHHYPATMSVTVVKEGNTLRVLQSSETIPDGQQLVLYTAEELARRSGYSPLEYARLESIFAQDKEDWGDSLAPFRQPQFNLPTENSNAQG